jgi:carboxypeptidase A2
MTYFIFRNIDKEHEEVSMLSMRKSEVITFDRYYRYEEINKYLDRLAKEHPENVKVKTAGKSYEGREIKYITITNGDGRSKNSIFIDGGIHAREWIAPAASLYIINQLVDSQSNFSKLLDKVDFVIQPLVNPDGYEFTFGFNRLWRKTRSRHATFSCTGVDANRNYDFHWHEVGSSDNTCAETYHGPKAFSENESQISRNIIDEVKANCKFFLTFHSYGNYLIYPNGYTNDLPENWQDNEDVAQAGAKAIREATGTEYTVGSTSNVLYLASGSSTDYALGVGGIPIAICMELTGGGFFGFDLPASEIEKTVKEVRAGGDFVDFAHLLIFLFSDANWSRGDGADSREQILKSKRANGNDERILELKSLSIFRK